MKRKEKLKKKIRRHKRIRVKIFGTSNRPRLCIFRSNKHIYAQLIDDEKGHVLEAASDLEITSSSTTRKIQKKEKEKEKKEFSGKSLTAFQVGKLISQKAQKKKIEKVVFDRGGYKYHGRVKALAEGAREGGLRF